MRLRPMKTVAKIATLWAAACLLSSPFFPREEATLILCGIASLALACLAIVSDEA